jgi:hypothetical protein
VGRQQRVDLAPQPRVALAGRLEERRPQVRREVERALEHLPDSLPVRPHTPVAKPRFDLA